MAQLLWGERCISLPQAEPEQADIEDRPDGFWKLSLRERMLVLIRGPHMCSADNEASHNNRHDASHAKVNEPYGRCLAWMATGKKHNQGDVWKKHPEEQC